MKLTGAYGRGASLIQDSVLTLKSSNVDVA